MRTNQDPETASRSGLRAALAWSVRRPTHTALVVVLFSLSGAASALGMLRWQHSLARWSFAGACWVIAAVVLLIALRAMNRRR